MECDEPMRKHEGPKPTTVKLVTISGSPHGRHTDAALHAYEQYLANKYSIQEEEIYRWKIPTNLAGCQDCRLGCVKGCRWTDEFMRELLPRLTDAQRVIFGSPVYLDMPTPQMVALLTRLNCMAEPTGREFFRGKKAYFVATAYCSGTKQVISTMRNACEMLGFTIEGRSSREYIQLWRDKKLRGGMGKDDAIYLP
jgi:multimeric flavodoxin WrbA